MKLQHLADRRTDVLHIRPDLIDIVPDFNARSQAHIAERVAYLKPLILARGVRRPLDIYKGADDRVKCVDGECRIRAVWELIKEGHDIPTVPCLPGERGATDADRILDLIICNESAPLDLLEQGSVFHRLASEHAIDESDMATRSGKSITHVRNCLALYYAPEEIKDLIRQGLISPSLTIELIKEARGDIEGLIQRVTAAVDTAKAQGKDHATRKHVPVAETDTKTTTESTDTPEALSDLSESEDPGDSTEDNPSDPDSADENPDTADAAPQPGAPTSNGGTIPFQDVPSGGGGPGGGGERILSRDTTKNLEKIERMLEKLNRDECNATLYDFCDSMVSVLQGEQDISVIKKQITS